MVAYLWDGYSLSIEEQVSNKGWSEQDIKEEWRISQSSADGLSFVSEVILGVGSLKGAKGARAAVKHPKIKSYFISKVEGEAKLFDAKRPPLQENPQHMAGQGLHADKTPLPKNSQEVYQKSIQDPKDKK